MLHYYSVCQAMEITQWYGISLGALVALYLVCRFFLAALLAARDFGAYFVLKHLIYPQIPKLLRGQGTITLLHSLLILAYISGNVLCVVFRTTSTAQLGTRSGLMSLINLIPLCAGGRMNLVAHICGLSYENYGRMHRWIGRVAVIQGLVHALISLAKMKSKPGIAQLPGLLAAGGMLLLLLLSFIFIRRLFYEIFLKTHLAFAIATVVTLWYHVVSKIVKIYLLIAISMLGTALALRVFLLLYRYSETAVVQQLDSNVVQVSLKVRRPWRFQAGQYMYLCVPGVSFWAWLQSHPFVLAWWYKDANGDTTVVFLIQSHTGFTRKLAYSGSLVRAFMEGPYGVEKDLGSYGTVIMFATGIGIAGQLPYIRKLLEGHNNCEVITQRISLFWQFDEECHETWVGGWMNELLRLNEHSILKISLYALGNYYDPELPKNSINRIGKGLTKEYQAFSVEELIRDEVKGQKGRIVVAVCVDPTTKDRIRKTVGEVLTKNIRFEELGFCPLAARNSTEGS